MESAVQPVCRFWPDYLSYIDSAKWLGMGNIKIFVTINITVIVNIMIPSYFTNSSTNTKIMSMWLMKLLFLNHIPYHFSDIGNNIIILAIIL